MAEEQVIDDYYVSLQKGEIDSRARIGDLSKEELLDKLKENLNADLDQIAAQINSSGKDKWRNSTVKSTAQQNKHIRFSSPSDDDEENKENKEERLEKKQSPRKSNEKSPSPSKRNGGKKPFNNRKQSPSKPKKVIDYNQFEALNGAPRVNEIIAFQILEISSNFTPEVSDYKVGTVIDFDSKTNETTLQLHSEYNSILKRSNKFSIVFEETEDDEQLTYEDSPRSNKSNKEEEIIKVDWRNLMNIKLIPEGFDLKQLQDEDELEEESEQKATNGHKSEDESEEQVIDDYYETVKKVDRYNKSNTNKKTNCCGKQQQQQKQEAKPDQKSVVKKQQEEKAKNDDLNRIASSVNAHAKAKWKNSAPSKAANSNAPKHIRFPSGSSSSSSCSSSSSSSSDSSSSNDDEEMRSANENKSKAKTNKNNQDRKEKVAPSKKSEQTVNKVKQLLTAASPEIKPNSSQVTKTKSPKTQSLKSIDSKNKTKEEEKEKEKPTVAIDTQTFMIQIGNVFELNSNSKEVTVKFNSNYKSEINLKITNKDQSDDVSEKKKKKKKEEKSPKVELDWKNSMNVKLIPNEISLNMKSQKEGEEEKEEDDDVKMKESDSSSNESESESESEEEEKEIVASKKSSNQKTANQKRKINEPARHQKQTSQKVNEEKSNSKTTKTDSSSSSKKATHIRFDSSSSDSSSSSSSCSSASSDSSTSSDSEDEPIERKPQPNLKSKQYTNQQQYNKPVAKKNQQQEASTSSAAKTSPQKQANNTQQQEQRNKYYQPSKEEQVNAISYNRAFLLQNPKDMSDFKKVFNQTKLNAPNPEEFLLKYDQDDQHPPELIIDEEEVLAQQQQQLIESATSQYQESSSYQDQEQQTTDDQLQFLQEQQNAFVAPPKIDFTKFEPLSGVPNAEDKIAFQLLEISPNYTPEVSSYKVATVLGFDHNSGEITLKLDDNVLDKPSTSLVEGLDLLANGEFRPQEPKDDVLRMDWRNLMNIRLLPKAHL